MAWRVTAEEVQEIIETGNDYLGNALSIDPFVNTANALVDYVVSKDTDGELTAALQKQIELYLSAHYYEHRDQQYTSRSTGGASGSFMGSYGLGLEGSKWGQSAKRLDVTGMLAMLDSPPRPKAKVFWLGKAPSEQIDYEDRD